MKRSLSLVAFFAALSPLACNDSQPVGPDLLNPLFEIVDAVHNQGNPHFYWLPPMVEEANPSGFFDGSVEPIVQICEWTGDDCVLPLLAEFTMTSGPGSETIRLVPEDEHFIVNWHTNEFGLDAAKTYRIQVVVSGQVLGLADLDVVNGGKELKKVDTGMYVPLKDGRTLPIKFRAEEGALLPDLTVVHYCGPSSVFLGDRINPDITVANLGAGPVAGIPWILHYYLSTDELIDEADFYLGGGLGYHHIVDLEPGETFTMTDGGTPSGLEPGFYHLLLLVDASGLVTEYDEGNNVVEYCSLLEVKDPLLEGLIAHYPLEQIDGGTTPDQSGNGFIGTVFGNLQVVPGMRGNAFLFDGSDEYVQIGADPAFNVQNLTVTAWVKGTTDGESYVLSFGSEVPYSIGTRGGGGRYRMRVGDRIDDPSGIQAVGTTEADGQWHFLAGVYDGSAATIYVDGVPEGQVAHTAGLGNVAYPLTIGIRNLDKGGPFPGIIDEVRLFNRPLSQAEIQNLMNR